ncbi:MAG: hypothetical protein V1667_03285 [bacterium]
MPLTPEQFNKIVTKEEFKELKEEFKELKEDVKKIDDKLNKVIVEAVNIKEDMKEFVKKDHFDKKMDEVLSAVDKITKKYEDHKIEHISNLAAHDRFEGRIKGLEKKQGITQFV